MEFGIGEASATGAWTADAAEVTAKGSFGKVGGPEVGKYEMVFKTQKDADGKNENANTATSSREPSGSGTAPTGKGSASKVCVTTWGIAAAMAAFAVML